MNGAFEKQGSKDGIFEVQLYAEEMKYLLSVLPKSYTLVKASKLAKPKIPTKRFSDLNGLDYDDYGADAKRAARNIKSVKDYTAELASGGQKGNKVYNEAMRKCEQVLQQLTCHRSAEPFLEPVNPIAQGLHDYTSIVKDPMDLGTIRKKLKSRDYLKISQFVADVRKVFSNSCLYNQKASQIYLMTIEMSDYFEKLNREILESNTPGGTDLNKVNNDMRDTMMKGRSFVPKTSVLGAANQKSALDYYQRPMTMEEKKNLTESIRKLTKNEQLQKIVEIIEKAGVELEDGTNLNVETLPTKTARQIEKYVKSQLEDPNTSSKKGKSGEAEKTETKKKGDDSAAKIADSKNPDDSKQSSSGVKGVSTIEAEPAMKDNKGAEQGSDASSFFSGKSPAYFRFGIRELRTALVETPHETPIHDNLTDDCKLEFNQSVLWIRISLR